MPIHPSHQIVPHCRSASRSLGYTEQASLQRHPLLQCFNMAAIPTQLYDGLTCLHSVLAVVAVGTGVHEPRLWPGPFGRWKDAYIIRRLW